MGIFDDASLDARVAPIVKATHLRARSDASLEAAALLDESPSPAMVEGDATWLEVIDDLAAGGLTPDQIMRVCVRATTRAYDGNEGPGPALFSRLFANPALASLVREIANELAAIPEPTPAQREVGDAIATPYEPRSEPTPRARESLEKMRRKHAQARAVRSLSTFVEWAYIRRITVEAPELATMDAWTAASPARQKAIADSVASALSTYTTNGPRRMTWKASLESYGGPTIAVVTHGADKMSVVPGGVVDVGFSEIEEAAVRARSEEMVGCTNHHELYEALFDKVDLMRPVVRVTIGPMLVAQGTPEAKPEKDVHGALVTSLFRVPTEAEWEHLARGGLPHELTYRGDVVPDTRDEYLATLGDAETANAFGLWGFGLVPEICADRWAESHDDLPLDGSPRRGDGPRVVRGGGSQLAPWQNTGEWHLMLTAFRTPQTTWKKAIATRHALGIICR